MLINVEKIESGAQRQAVVRNATEYLSNTNIMEQPSGEATLGPYQLQWTSELIEPVRPGLNQRFGRDEFTIGLYDLNVEVSITNISRKIQFNMRATGYHGQEELPF
jgi:general secretion pathway protein I